VNRHSAFWKTAGCFSVILVISLVSGCSPTQSAPDTKPGVKKIAAGSEFAGFLKDYASLKPNPNIDGDALTFAATDAKQNLRSYFAIIVDPVEVYVATDADASKVSDSARIALTNYFQHALIQAVSDAFPLVDKPGPLTLRLRAAIVGVDVGGQVAAGDAPADARPFERALNIGKVAVEMELVDSVSGERIAAMVDRAKLGDGAEVGAADFSRVQKFAAAREAFDEWASRVRLFLDSAHELKGEDAERADKSYRPYGGDESKP
jgi:Protein of unknown function (DUF3313)